MARRKQRGGSVRDRVPGLNKSTDNGQGEAPVAVAEKKKTEGAPAGPQKTPAKLEDYLAAQLHESQSNLMEARADNLRMSQQLLAKDQEILRLKQRLHNMEVKEVEKLKGKLRENHKLTVGTSFKQDDDTGEVFRVENQATQ
jgi:flagellar motility protein MotE (MotC chaperone)